MCVCVCVCVCVCARARHACISPVEDVVLVDVFDGGDDLVEHEQRLALLHRLLLLSEELGERPAETQHNMHSRQEQDTRTGVHSQHYLHMAAADL